MQHHNTKSYRLDEVNISFLDSKKTAPLVITPRWNDSLEFLITWTEQNRAWLDDQILRYGAILIRNFQVDDAIAFEKATLALQPNLSDAYRGTSPRSCMPGTKYAFTAADVPVNYPIAQHCEMSFLKAPPRQLYFGCIKASKSAGGETALCDFRKVYDDLLPELRYKLTTKKLKYTRTHKKVGERLTYDVGAMLSWHQLFGTPDQMKVEEICREEGAPVPQWIGPDEDTFFQEWVDEPFQRHPVTGELAWFNHSNVFHWTTFPAELWFAFNRVQDIRLFIHFVLITIFSLIKYGLLGYKMALNPVFGDGEAITLQEMNEIRRAIHKNMVFSRWQKGDIMAIDNFSTSHGRQPTYDKGRKVIVAWSQPHDKTQPIKIETSPIKTETAPISVQKEIVDISKGNVGAIPDLMESPENSPSSTLTTEEANELRQIFLHNRFDEQMSMVFQKREELRSHKRLASCPNFFDPIVA
jgi:alpha-ketoglutarate-dependent taurine dioxygenase